MSNEQLVGKYILQSNITLKSPLIIGSGDDKELDIEIVKDENGTPYIPATSFLGALRHFISDNFPHNNDWDKFFWGETNKNNTSNAYQSSVIIDDLYLNDNQFHITSRDGIKINYDTGITEDTGKFDFEILEPGISFNLNMEINVREAHNPQMFQEILDAIQQSLNNQNFSVGAFTTRGYGRISANTKIYHFDFKNKNDVQNWITFIKENKILKQPELIKTDIKPDNNYLELYGTFILKDSLIIGSAIENPNYPDASSLTLSNENYVVPGSSLKGPIRNRAERILKTLNKFNIKLINNLFGFEGEKNIPESAIKSRVSVDETVIPKKSVIEKIISRIKIDRFTGGTIETALFDALPIWAKNDETEVDIVLKVKNPKDWEIGLFLLVFKDIWTGDLAFGGDKSIGRGTFEGKKITFKYNDKNISIDDNISENDKNYLNSFVQKLSQEVV